MANIHGLDGLGRYALPEDNQAEQQIPDFLKSLFVSRAERPVPRSETFKQMLYYTFTPGLKQHHFIALVSLFQVFC